MLCDENTIGNGCFIETSDLKFDQKVKGKKKAQVRDNAIFRSILVYFRTDQICKNGLSSHSKRFKAWFFENNTLSYLMICALSVCMHYT